MIPTKLYHAERNRSVMINGDRPSALRINHLNSNVIQKNQPNNISCSAKQKQKYKPSKRKPVIIYAHSPKIIHAQASEFMALVQRLTGSTDHHHHHQQQPQILSNTIISDHKKMYDDNCKDINVEQASAAFSTSCYSYLADVPLFTPNSNDSLSFPTSPSFEKLRGI